MVYGNSIGRPEIKDGLVVSVMVSGKITPKGKVNAPCIVTADGLFGSDGLGTRSFDSLTVDLKEVLPGMGIANARFGEQDTYMTIVGRPDNNKMPHEKFHNLLVDNYGVYKFRVGNLELTWIIHELDGVVPEHGHADNVVGEWQMHLMDSRHEACFCKNGYSHGHPDGWGKRMIAVKLIAEVVDE